MNYRPCLEINTPWDLWKETAAGKTQLKVNIAFPCTVAVCLNSRFTPQSEGSVQNKCCWAGVGGGSKQRRKWLREKKRGKKEEKGIGESGVCGKFSELYY